MLLKTILVPLSAILAVVSALPTALPTDSDAALQAEAELDARIDFPGGYEDEGEIIDITSWVAGTDAGVSARSNSVLGRNLGERICGTGKSGASGQFEQWFRAAGNRQICMKNGETKTWVDGKNRFKAANRTGGLRCNKFSTFALNVGQMSSCGRPQECGGSCWGKDHVFPGQTFSLWSV